MARLTMTNTISTSNFIYDKERRVFFGEASMMPQNFTMFDREAKKNRFSMVSAKTGKAIVFDVIEDRNGENEIIGWYGIPVHKEMRAAGVKVVIAND